MKHRLITTLLSLLLLLSLTSPTLAAGAHAGYSDVPADHWSAQSVTRATQLGLFQGVAPGLFGRGQPITRAAFVTALGRLFRWESVTPATPSFSDVAADSWYYAAVETAFSHGAFVSADLSRGAAFRPNDHITREEMAVMLVRSLGYASLAGTVADYGSPFSDVTVSRGFITIAYDMGIVSGIGDGKFAPASTATREQAAAMLVRLYDRYYAQSRLVTSAAGGSEISVPTPEPQADSELPTTPLEPMADLYDALRKARAGGADMGAATLKLTAGGYRTVVADGKIAGSGLLSKEEVEKILAGEDVRLHYSSRYESAYCIYRPNRYQTATLWYQSEESLAAKLQLARLFGVIRYYLA